MADKVKFGIKNVHLFPIASYVSSVPTYGTVIDVPGAVSLPWMRRVTSTSSMLTT